MRHSTEARDLLRLRSPLVIAMSVSAACPPKEASRSQPSGALLYPNTTFV
jgi:hypothetical protein